VIIYNVDTGQDVCRLRHKARYAFFTEPDQVVTFGRDGDVCWWSFPEGELLSTVPFRGCITTGGHSVVSNTVVYVDSTYASVFDLARKEDIWQIQGTSPAYCVAISNDGELVLTGEKSGAARLWSVSERRELRQVEDSNNYIQACAISPDKSLALVGSWTSMAFLHNLTTKELVRSHRGTVLPMSAAFSPDGEFYALGCEGMIHVWDTAT
jgi:WD40 repeat protein